MSKSSRARRSDDEFKPPSGKKAKHKPEEHQSVQRIRLLDLIKGNFLEAGEEVFVKEQEGVITERGTIKVLSGSGYIEYSNPTSWTKQVTGRENGGWGQIRIKSSKMTLSSVKEQYQKTASAMDYMDDSDTKQIGYTSQDQLNSSTSSQAPPLLEAPPSDLTLPLKVRFIGDEDRVFKIIWVSPDFKEFHTEYQGTLYTNLADFVNKIFEDFQKPANDPTSPPPGNLRFDELMYELSPGKWVRLAGNLFPSELMPQTSQHGVDQSYQSQPHILQQSLQHTLQQGSLHPSALSSYPPSPSPSPSPAASASSLPSSVPLPSSSCNTSTTPDGNHHSLPHPHPHHLSASFDDSYGGVDEDEDDDDYIIVSTTDRKRRPTSRRANYRRVTCYKCLVYTENSDAPIRVNVVGPTSVREAVHTILTESGLKVTQNLNSTMNGSELDLLRDYSFDIEDQDFGSVKVAFPRSIANFPTKCKIYIRRKEANEIEHITDKEGVNDVQMEEKGILEKEKRNDKPTEEENKDTNLLL